MSSYTLQLDTTGTSVDNKITEEYHTLTESNYKDYAFIIPDFSPFYVDTNTLKVEHIQADGSRKTLNMDIDFYPCLQFVAATRSIGKEVWGGITFTNRNIEGKVVISYQSLGGPWTANRTYILESLHERNVNPRTIYWDAIEPDTIPESFPVIDHDQDYDTIYGQDGVIAAIDRVITAIETKGGMHPDYVNHLMKNDNPHNTTLEQLGYAPSTQEDMDNQSGDNKFLTVDLFYSNIDKVIKAKTTIYDKLEDLSDGASDTSTEISDLNTSLNIKIENIKGNIENKINAIENRFITDFSNITNRLDELERDTNTRINGISDIIDNKLLVGLANLRAEFTTTLNEHIANTSNPHNVTKEQVGLGNLMNYELATDLDISEGVAVDKYLTLRQIVTLLNTNPSHALVGYPTNIELGQIVNVKLVTERIASGTLFTWRISHYTTDSSMFDTDHGEIVVNNGEANFSFKVANYLSNSGDFKFIIEVLEGIDDSRLVARSTTITLSSKIVSGFDYVTGYSLYDASLDKGYLDMAELLFNTADRDMVTRTIVEFNQDEGRVLSKENLKNIELVTALSPMSYFTQEADIDMAEVMFMSGNSMLSSREITRSERI